MPSDKALHYAHLHVIVFIWGFTAVLGALISIDAIPLVWYRMGIATLILLVYLLIKKQPLAFSPKVLIKFAVAGLLIALHWVTFFGAVKEANVSVTLAVMSTGAFFTAFLEPLFFKRRIIPYEVFFGLLAMVGLYLIFSVDTQYTLGIGLALISAFLGALFNVINGQLVQRYQASVISFYELGFGALFISIYLVATGQFGVDLFQLSSSDLIYLLILASICTAYAFIASVHVMKWISPYTVMLTINLEPVYGIILALLILGDAEFMSPRFYYGALIILLTVLANGVIKLKGKRKRIS